ncbi:alpha/beta hydrolase [Burkholderia paludis]|uniref:alpha/beta fold hydrolase n=1 Tax=Burkholderia paludis TaxID=1506587 RepID=UPI0004DB587A|nr:alpha/beta hydrolase [Burkholderia paludis]KFG92874.1 alpha/beta hydrolase [Burkholderia paludis]
MKIFPAPWSVTKALARLAMTGMTMAALGPGLAHAATDAPNVPGKVQVEVVGSGRPVLMIPGLNSSAEVWRDTCRALQPQVQCLLVQLPGFAGAAAAVPRPADFLPAMRDELLTYLQARGLAKVAVMGHSLGGVLAMELALKAPEAVGPLIIVDSLPFYAAAMNPHTNAQNVAVVAGQLRQALLTADDASFQARNDAIARTLTRSVDHLPELQRWGRDTDRATMADALYSMMMRDLRDDVAGIHTPVLVLGAWASYQPFGGTEASVREVFQAQYAKLQGVQIAMSAQGYHFLMWDDPRWLQDQVRTFLAAHP